MDQCTCGGVVEQIGQTESPHETVLRAVSVASERSPAELPPLQTTIDVDAMEGVLASGESDVRLQFRYLAFEVTVGPQRVCVRDSR